MIFHTGTGIGADERAVLRGFSYRMSKLPRKRRFYMKIRTESVIIASFQKKRRAGTSRFFAFRLRGSSSATHVRSLRFGLAESVARVRSLGLGRADSVARVQSHMFGRTGPFTRVRSHGFRSGECGLAESVARLRSRMPDRAGRKDSVKNARPRGIGHLAIWIAGLCDQPLFFMGTVRLCSASASSAAGASLPRPYTNQ